MVGLVCFGVFCLFVCFLAILPIKAENKGSFNKKKGENGLEKMKPSVECASCHSHEFNQCSTDQVFLVQRNKVI